jgi:hypothetical protein
MKYLAIHDRVIERCTEEDIKVLTAKNLDAGNMETASGLLPVTCTSSGWQSCNK